MITVYELWMNYSQRYHNQGNLLEKDHDSVFVCVGGGGGYELWGEVNSTYYKIIFSKIVLFLSFVLFPPTRRAVYK